MTASDQEAAGPEGEYDVSIKVRVLASSRMDAVERAGFLIYDGGHAVDITVDDVAAGPQAPAAKEPGAGA